MTKEQREAWEEGNHVDEGAYGGFNDLFSNEFPFVIRLDSQHLQINNYAVHESVMVMVRAIPKEVPIYDSPDKVNREEHLALREKFLNKGRSQAEAVEDKAVEDKAVEDKAVEP